MSYRQSIKDLKLQCELNYNAKSFVIHKAEALNILDYIRRIENLNAVYEVLIDKASLGVTCNDCPFIETCIEKDTPSDDCQIRFLSKTNTLGEIL